MKIQDIPKTSTQMLRALATLLLLLVSACAPPTAKKNQKLIDVQKAYSTLMSSSPNACVCDNGAGRGSFALVPDCHEDICPKLSGLGVQVAYTLSGVAPGTLASYCGTSSNGVPKDCTGHMSGPGVDEATLTTYYDPSNELIAFGVPYSVTALESQTQGLNLTFSLIDNRYNNSVPLGDVNIGGVMQINNEPEDLLVYVCRSIITENGIRNPGGEAMPLFTGSFTGSDFYCVGRNRDPDHPSAPYVIHNYTKPNQNVDGVPNYLDVNIDNYNLFSPSECRNTRVTVFLDVGFKLHSIANTTAPFLPFELPFIIDNDGKMVSKQLGTVLLAEKVSTDIYSCDWAKNLFQVDHVTFRILQNIANPQELYLQPLWNTAWGRDPASQTSPTDSSDTYPDGKRFEQIVNDFSINFPGGKVKEYRNFRPGQFFCGVAP